MEIFDGFAIGSICIGGLCVVISLFMIICAQTTAKGSHLSVVSDRENLIIQLENHVYDFDTIWNSDILYDGFAIITSESKRELYNDVAKFNKNVAKYTYYENNPWLNWYYGNVWTGVEPIDLDYYIKNNVKAPENESPSTLPSAPQQENNLHLIDNEPATA